MQATFWISALAGVLAGGLNAATIGYEVTPLGGNDYQYSYFVSGIVFQANQDFDIRFDPTSYALNSLSNPVAGSGFTAMILQPNNPIGTQGDYIATAQINNPPLTGPFGLDVVYGGMGVPGSQSFTIDQINGDGSITVLESGTTSQVPEPSTILVIAAVGAGLAVRLRRRRVA